jgi:hypothetical protein
VEDAMSDEVLDPSPVLTLETVAGRIATLATEVATLRESIVTAAEWDAEARRVRQSALDATLTAVRIWLRVLVGVHALLIILMIWLLAVR